ncbi:hypothetical protein K1T71_000685 [Dendrolimus kikuchii]|uniref:Uncharacterized protein n=1 Tax=Dendrolimus kikuchii TaxID=765133 RepID=A0ACC1DK28_9NEOP|nr:hypothetical protein K1T71_000685 [Dendrolimus kikuchii]
MTGRREYVTIADPSAEENCIQLTLEKEKVINDTIDKITIFLSKIQEELDDIDIRILRVDIDKHSDQEREEKDLKLKITINDCEENNYTDYEFNKIPRHYHKHNKNAYQPEEIDDITFNIDQTSEIYKTDNNTAKNDNVEETTSEYSNFQRGDTSSDAINSDTSYSNEEIPIIYKELDNNNHAQKRRHHRHRKNKKISDTAILNDNIPEYFDYNEFFTNPEMLPMTYGSDDTTTKNPNESGPSQTVYDENSMISVDKNDATVQENDLPAKRYHKHRHHKRKHDYIDVDQIEIASDGIYNAAIIEEASTPIYPNLREVEVKFDNTAVSYDDIQRPIKSKNHHKQKHPRRLFNDDKVIVTRSENFDESDTAFVMDSPLPHYLNYQNDDQTNNFPTNYSLKTVDDKVHLSKHHDHKNKHPGLTASGSAIAESYEQDSVYSENEENGNKDDTIGGTAIFDDETRPNHKKHGRHHKNRKNAAKPVSNYAVDNNTASGNDNNQFKGEIGNKNGTSTGHTEVIDDETQPKHKKHHGRPKKEKYYEEIGDNKEEDVKRSKSTDDEIIVRDDELNDDMRRRHRKKKPHRNFTFDDFIRYLEENKDDGKEKCVCVQGLQDW